jgi:hypothetical protein
MENELRLIQIKTKKIIFLLSKVKKTNNWTKEEDNILLEKAKEFKYRNWRAISSFLPGRSDIQCSARYKRIRPGIIKGPWTKDEDHRVIKLVKTFGKNWSLIAKYISSRNGKQIRDRFLNNLDPNLKKDNFTPEEDAKILEIYYKEGPSWSKMATLLEGRTGDTIKNRFYSTLKKKIIKIKKFNKDSERREINNNNSYFNDKTISNDSNNEDDINDKSQLIKDENINENNQKVLENQMALLINLLKYTQSKLNDINGNEIDFINNIKVDDLN